MVLAQADALLGALDPLVGERPLAPDDVERLLEVRPVRIVGRRAREDLLEEEDVAQAAERGPVVERVEAAPRRLGSTRKVLRARTSSISTSTSSIGLEEAD